MKITKTILILSFISLFADMASEMYYVITPLYLQSIGVSIISIGILEGVAEFVAGVSKGFFGNWSDHIQKRKPFIILGYFLSAISKPFIVLSQHFIFLFSIRSVDRLGKGIRSAARDSMLSAEATPETKSRVFGFHRAFDTIGAIAGPAIVLAILHFKLCTIKEIFIWGVVPGLLSVLLIFFVKEKKIFTPNLSKRPSFFAYFKHWKKTTLTYKKITIAMCIFYLSNSSDVFLLLKAKEIIINEDSFLFVIKAYILYNIVYASTSYPLAKLADKFPKKYIIGFGLLIFAIVYYGFSIAKTSNQVYILFSLYGIYAAATEGVVKAWISNITPKNKQATALGLFASLQSLIIMLASFIGGVVWYNFGSTSLFFFSALLAGLVGIYFLFEKYKQDY